MTRTQASRYYHLRTALQEWGIGPNELDALLRCSRGLSTWAEHECNGTIQRDEDTGKCYWYSAQTGKRLSRTSDRETGALRRARMIAEPHGLTVYHQGDPRGCALYLLRPGDIPEGRDPGAYYSRGIAVTID